MEQIEKVSIAIQPSFYETLRDITNDVWFVLSEFVDNAVSSYLNNKQRLKAANPNYQLEVNLKVFEEMKEATRKAHYQTKTK